RTSDDANIDNSAYVCVSCMCAHVCGVVFCTCAWCAVGFNLNFINPVYTTQPLGVTVTCSPWCVFACVCVCVCVGVCVCVCVCVCSLCMCALFVARALTHIHKAQAHTHARPYNRHKEDDVLSLWNLDPTYDPTVRLCKHTIKHRTRARSVGLHSGE